MKEKRYKIIILFLILLFAGCLILFFLEYNKNPKNNNEKIELKTTDINTKIKEGIYITDVSEVVENAMPSIVSITSKTKIASGNYGPFSSNSRYVEGAGSGIIIGNTNNEILILTNYHVVDDANELTVKFIDDEVLDARIKGKSEEKDIAIIAIDATKIKKETTDKIKVAVLGDSNELKVGKGIIAIGNALGYGQSVTTGVVSALDREVKTENYINKMIQIDAAINGGNSGGALLNNKGEVVGINSAKYSSSNSNTSIEGMGFAIPISDVKELIDKLINSEDSSEIKLGIGGYMTNSEKLSEYNLPLGFYITSISEDGYAYNSALEVGNIITHVDNKEIKKYSDLSDILDTKKIGDKLILTIQFLKGENYIESEIIVNL